MLPMVLPMLLQLAACSVSAPSEPAPSASDEPAPSASDEPAPSASDEAAPTASDVRVQGWPHTGENEPGLYSWGSGCAGPYCTSGWMHNGYGSGNLEFRIRAAPGLESPDDGTSVTVAGHDAIHRQIGSRNEVWIVDIDGARITISLETQVGTSEADLAEAHGIIDSMYTEERDGGPGFRLVFTLTTDDWDSG
jgi:hypothetical protein